MGERMRKFVFVFIVAFLFIGGLFTHQNLERFPQQDSQGGYLSLDLGFLGFQINEPIGVSLLMLISFLCGMIALGILQKVMQQLRRY